MVYNDITFGKPFERAGRKALVPKHYYFVWQTGRNFICCGLFLLYRHIFATIFQISIENSVEK